MQQRFRGIRPHPPSLAPLTPTAAAPPDAVVLLPAPFAADVIAVLRASVDPRSLELALHVVEHEAAAAALYHAAHVAVLTCACA